MIVILKHCVAVFRGYVSVSYCCEQTTSKTWWLKTVTSWGAWVSQLVEHPTLDFSSSPDLGAMRPSNCLTPHQAWNLLNILSPSLSASPHSH